MQQAGDSRYSMLLAENLLRHGSFTLDRYDLPESDYQIERVAGHRYYAFPPGTSVLSVPLVALLHLRGLSALRPDGTYSLAGELKVDARISALLMAAFAALAYLTARLLLPVSLSVGVATVSAFGTQVFSTTSRSMWSDTWGILLVGLAAFLLLRSEARAEPANLPLLGTLEALAYVVRPTNSLVIVGTAIYVAWTRRRDVWQFLAAVALWLVLFFAYSWHHFHTLLPSYFSAGRLHFGDMAPALFGNLVSPGRGLLVYVPAVIAVGLVLALHWRTVRFRALLALAAFVTVSHFFILSGFGHWWGGHSYGARLTASLVPWLVLAAVISADGMRAAMRPKTHGPATLAVGLLCGVLCAASIAINAIGAFSQETARWNYAPENIDQTPERLWNWRRPQFLAPFVEPAGPFLPLPSDGLRLGAPDADRYLGLGWAPYPEGEFRWTDGPGATVRFWLEKGQPGDVELDLRPYLVPGMLPEQRLIVSMNARDIDRVALTASEFATYRVAVPGDVPTQENVLRLRLPDAASPSAVEGARDGRKLGVAVRSIRWHRR